MAKAEEAEGKKSVVIWIIIIVIAALLGSGVAMKVAGIGPFAPKEVVEEVDEKEDDEKDEDEDDRDEESDDEDKDEDEEDRDVEEEEQDEPAAVVEEPEEEVEHTYEVVVDNVTWTEARDLAKEAGGHLATITSKKEEKKIIKKAEKAGITYVWLGGRTGFDDDEDVEFKWITGEDVEYENWFDGEPSGMDMVDNDILEPYVMLWYVRDRWSWNDQRDELAYNSNDAIANQYRDKMGYVIEYEE